ncbi:MAG: hypothetical protein PHE35_00615 [Bacteroidales bacterium]|nr:hypothetical protein [Bacteroidales bacterium]MDD3105755.1 hypothetical protein [Bacteroidales bacterium]MDD4498953.1 hypothetical protein [Bacteroidales bacterium]
MNSETLVTLLLTVLAITFGIINARQKKRNATAVPPVRRDPDDWQESVPTIDGNVLPEEAAPATSPDAIYDQHIEKKSAPDTAKYGFNAKEAVLYSEILKPKFDEFG